MSTGLHSQTELANEADLRLTLAEIRDDAARAASREELTRLYRRAEYLIALTYSPSWQKKFGDQVEQLRQTAENEFSVMAHAVNQRAESIGTKPDYDETWGAGR